MRPQSSRLGRRVVWGVFVVLFVLHQDFWWWDRGTLVMGFLPVGLFYHATFSLVAACLWAFAILFDWPDHIEEWASEAPSGTTEPEANPPTREVT